MLSQPSASKAEAKDLPKVILTKIEILPDKKKKEREILEEYKKCKDKAFFVVKLFGSERVKILAFFCKQSYNNYKVERSGGRWRSFPEENLR